MIDYFNPLPLRRGRQYEDNEDVTETGISIHSLYAEGDFMIRLDLVTGMDFNPLPLRRGRPIYLHSMCLNYQFQSTPSTQRETPRISEFCNTFNNFNPLPLRRGRLYLAWFHARYFYFNPLPLRRGRPNSSKSVLESSIFQSTPSTQRET